MRILGNVEKQFADIVWENAPVSSRELVEICARDLNWKKSTTYTVLKKFCDRGIFTNDNSVVKCLISREEFISRQTVDYIDDEFSGSLPDFIAAFASRKSLRKEEIERIRKIITQYDGEEEK